jgi:hypothetical protein
MWTFEPENARYYYFLATNQQLLSVKDLRIPICKERETGLLSFRNDKKVCIQIVFLIGVSQIFLHCRCI